MLDKWTKELVEEVLRAKGWMDSAPEAVQDGWKYKLSDGTFVTWFKTTGTVSLQGKLTETRQEAQKTFSPKSLKSLTSDQRRVFVVYGHDSDALGQLRDLLKNLGLHPIILQDLPGGGDTLIEKLELVQSESDFACVLVTPDDKGYRAGCPNSLQYRARQNVVLEMGMVLAKLGRPRVAMLVKGEMIERPSDIGDLIYIPFTQHVEETLPKLGKHLRVSKVLLPELG